MSDLNLIFSCKAFRGFSDANKRLAKVKLKLRLLLFLFQNTKNLEGYNYTKGFLTSQELDFFLPSSIIWTDHKTRTKLWKLINTTHIDDYYCIESMECSVLLKPVGNFLEKEKKSERKDDSYHFFIASIYILGMYYSNMNRFKRNT